MMNLNTDDWRTTYRQGAEDSLIVSFGEPRWATLVYDDVDFHWWVDEETNQIVGFEIMNFKRSADLMKVADSPKPRS